MLAATRRLPLLLELQRAIHILLDEFVVAKIRLMELGVAVQEGQRAHRLLDPAST
jgi:hypothetical protein